MKVSNLQINTQNNRVNNNEVVSHSQNNKEIKCSYLPEDKVNVSIRNEDGAYTDIKQENLQKESDLKLLYIGHIGSRASVEGESNNDDTGGNQIGYNILNQGILVEKIKVGNAFKNRIDKTGEYIDVKQENLPKGLASSKKDDVWNAGTGGMFNAKGSQNGSIQGLNIKNKNIHLGHIGSEVSSKGKGGDQIGHNILNQGIVANYKIGDTFKDGIVGKNKGIDYWSAKKK